jgi:hypothetical protein
VELVRLAARDRTDAAIAKPETPFVRVDELDGQFPGMPGRAFTWTKPASSARSASAASSIWRRPLRLLGDVQGLSGTIAFVGKAKALKSGRERIP